MNDTPLLRVKSIHVDGLFDLFDHRVDLNLDERVTILHGPNGVGKTMLLQMVNALLKGKYGLFRQVPFKRFALEFTDDSRLELTIDSRKDKKGDTVLPILTLRLLRPGERTEEHDVASNQDVVVIAETIARRLPWVHRFEDDVWLDEKNETLGSAEEMVSLYGDELPPLLPTARGITDPPWLVDLRQQVTVHFIEAQRLLRFGPDETRRYRSRSRTVFTVLNYARDLKDRISETMARYGQQSQTLDQSFPQRLLSTKIATLEAGDLKRQMKELDAKRARLKEIGLLDEPQGHPFDTNALDRLDDTQLSVMTLYVHDTADKLAVLDDLARRTRILLDNVNRKFRHKRIRIDRERGLVAEGEEDRPLPLDKLSSGEQHELVLHYDLLFRVRPNTLVLIDEPELSLHVAWQKRFLPDLLEIVTTAQFDALIATHSPFVVGDRSDLMIGLDVEPT
jgi:ABC-type transport system involved in cytochrome c biogenesis ATPase subunit